MTFIGLFSVTESYKTGMATFDNPPREYVELDIPGFPPCERPAKVEEEDED